MVDFDELKDKAESLLGEHADQVESGIDKLADLAGKQFGHAAQIDQAAGKLKDFVDEQQQQPPKKRPGTAPPGKRQQGQRRNQGQGQGPGQGPGQGQGQGQGQGRNRARNQPPGSARRPRPGPG